MLRDGTVYKFIDIISILWNYDIFGVKKSILLPNLLTGQCPLESFVASLQIFLVHFVLHTTHAVSYSIAPFVQETLQLFVLYYEHSYALLDT
jgi:hypothetical protein